MEWKITITGKEVEALVSEWFTTRIKGDVHIKEAAAKAEQEAREAEEKKAAAIAEEARREALKPAKEKVLDFIRTVNTNTYNAPISDDEKLQFICDSFVDVVQGVADKTIKQVEEL